MGGFLGYLRAFYDAVNRVFEPLYRSSGALAGLAFIVMLALLPSLVEALFAVDLPVIPTATEPIFVVFLAAASLFVFFVAIETVTGIVANTSAFFRWLLDLFDAG